MSKNNSLEIIDDADSNHISHRKRTQVMKVLRKSPNTKERNNGGTILAMSADDNI